MTPQFKATIANYINDGAVGPDDIRRTQPNQRIDDMLRSCNSLAIAPA